MARRPSVEWLDLALRALAEAGPAALVPDALARRAGLTRGAFYHRFASVEAFHVELLDCWRRRNTDAVISAADSAVAGPERRQALSKTAAAIDHALDRAVRAWSQHDARARAAVAAVDAARIAYIRDCLEPSQARNDRLARALYLVFIGAQHVHPELDGAQLQSLTDAIDDGLVRGLSV